MEKTIIAKSPDELVSVAETILSSVPGQRVFALYGEMGSGKTTLIKAFCKVLGSTDVVSSPTFSLVNEYEDADGNPLYHFDFYRIKKLEEVFDIGFEEYIDSGNYCFIEWPEMMAELLPETYVYISIKVKNQRERIITWSLYPKFNAS